MTNIRFIETQIKMPLMILPVRSIFVRVGDHEILISPGSKIPRDQYDPKWKITDLVASNMFHHPGVPKAKSLYPKAKTWAVPGLAQKRQDIQWDKILTQDQWPYSNELVPLLIEGMPSVNEVVFFHKPSKTLIVTDLCFNMLDMKGLGARLILSLFGTYNRFGVSRFFMAGVKDRKLFEGSLKKVFEFDFDNIILTHGQNVMGGAKQKLRDALKARGYSVG